MFRKSDQNVENQSYRKQHRSFRSHHSNIVPPLPTLHPSSENEEKENNRALMTVSSLQNHLVAEPGKIAQIAFCPGHRSLFSPHAGDTEGARSGAKDRKMQNNPVHSCLITRNSEYCITLT